MGTLRAKLLYVKFVLQRVCFEALPNFFSWCEDVHMILDIMVKIIFITFLTYESLRCNEWTLSVCNSSKPKTIMFFSIAIVSMIRKIPQSHTADQPRVW